MALYARAATGKGAVVDASLTHGTAYLGTLISNLHATGAWYVQQACAWAQPRLRHTLAGGERAVGGLAAGA